MDPIFEKRVGAYILSRPFWTNVYVPGIFASRPMARLRMFGDKFLINILGKEFTIPYGDIDFLEKGFFKIIIHHHCPSIDKYVYLTNTGTCRILFNKIKEIVKDNKLPIEIR